MTRILLLCGTLAAMLAGCAGTSSRPSPADAGSTVPGSTVTGSTVTSSTVTGSTVTGPTVSTQTAERAANVALAQVGRPYRYGGSSPKGFDCSGLVSYSYASTGVSVSRETRTLRTQASLIGVAQLRPGDLVFFDQEGKKYSHVGIYLGDGRFVHAPSSGGRVRVDRLDSDYWERHFVEARRI